MSLMVQSNGPKETTENTAPDRVWHGSLFAGIKLSSEKKKERKTCYIPMKSWLVKLGILRNHLVSLIQFIGG